MDKQPQPDSFQIIHSFRTIVTVLYITLFTQPHVLIADQVQCVLSRTHTDSMDQLEIQRTHPNSTRRRLKLTPSGLVAQAGTEETIPILLR